MGWVENKTKAIKEICDLLYLEHSKVPTEWVLGLLFFAETLNDGTLLKVQKILQENKVFKPEGLTWECAKTIIEDSRAQNLKNKSSV
jgi:hypothetical protein